jgi:hypothetical protein
MGVGPGIELIKYPNIIDTLASQGITQSRAFSLDLRGVDSPTGKLSNPSFYQLITEMLQVQSSSVVSTQ